MATPTLAQDVEPIFPEFAARQDMTLVRVRPGARIFFHHDVEVEGCPAPIAKCLRRAFVVPGDLVLTGEVRGRLVVAFYTNTTGRPTEGWLDRAALAPVAVSQPDYSAWLGHWAYDEADIDISATARPRHVKAEGTAFWGMHDPDRVARGAVHDGEFAGESDMAGDRVLFVDSEDDSCRVSMRLIGPYLVAADNLRCGGVNVTFSGIYRRTSDRH